MNDDQALDAIPQATTKAPPLPPRTPTLEYAASNGAQAGVTPGRDAYRAYGRAADSDLTGGVGVTSKGVEVSVDRAAAQAPAAGETARRSRFTVAAGADPKATYSDGFSIDNERGDRSTFDARATMSEDSFGMGATAGHTRNLGGGHAVSAYGSVDYSSEEGRTEGAYEAGVGVNVAGYAKVGGRGRLHHTSGFAVEEVRAEPDGGVAVDWSYIDEGGVSLGASFGAAGADGASSSAHSRSGTERFASQTEADAFIQAGQAPGLGPSELFNQPPGTRRSEMSGDSYSFTGRLGAGTGSVSAGQSSGESEGVHVTVLDDHRVQVAVVRHDTASWSAGAQAVGIGGTVQPDNRATSTFDVWMLDLTQPEAEEALMLLRTGKEPSDGPGVVRSGQGDSATRGRGLNVGVGPVGYTHSASSTRTRDSQGRESVQYEEEQSGAASFGFLTGNADLDVGSSKSSSLSLKSTGEGQMTTGVSGSSRAAAEGLAAGTKTTPNWLAYAESSQAPDVTIERSIPPSAWQRLSADITGNRISTGKPGMKVLRASLSEHKSDDAAQLAAWQVFIETGEGRSFMEQHLGAGEGERYLSVEGMSELGGNDERMDDWRDTIQTAERQQREGDTASVDRLRPTWVGLRARLRQLKQADQLAVVPVAVCEEEVARTSDLLDRVTSLIDVADAQSGTDQPLTKVVANPEGSGDRARSRLPKTKRSRIGTKRCADSGDFMRPGWAYHPSGLPHAGR